MEILDCAKKINRRTTERLHTKMFKTNKTVKVTYMNKQHNTNGASHAKKANQSDSKQEEVGEKVKSSVAQIKGGHKTSTKIISIHQ